MQLNDIKPNYSSRKARRVGRGGKRGTFSGRGSKGQKARGARLGADFRGGSRPLWKVFPKRRGANKKTEIKHRFFRLANKKAAVINLSRLNEVFADGDTVSPASLAEKGLVAKGVKKVKILGEGELEKNLKFDQVTFSKTAQSKAKLSNEPTIKSF